MHWSLAGFELCSDVRDGAFAPSRPDVVADADIDDATRQNLGQWTGCVAGALTRGDYMNLLEQVGLTGIEIIDSHRVHAHARSSIIRARKEAH